MGLEVDEDFYIILGVCQDCTTDDIKRAFKRLALKYHPDKNNGEGDDRFKKINDAYQILSDPKRRLMYDYERMSTDTESHRFKSFIDSLFESIQQFTFKYKQQQSKKAKQSIGNIKVSVDVTLDEVYRGEVKKLCVRVKRDKSWDVKVCYINLVNLKDRYFYPNCGDELECGGGNQYSDIEVSVNIKSHKYIKQEASRYDLYIDYNMSLYEYCYGIDVEIPYLDDSIIHLKKMFTNTEVSGNVLGTVIFKERGLPYTETEGNDLCYGDLYIYCRLSLPRPCEIDVNDDDFKKIMNKYYNNARNFS